MGLFDNAVPGGNITKPLMIALGALLVGKMLSGKSAEPAAPQAPVPAPAGTDASADGGLLGGLGGLLDKLKDAGHGNVADSWVGTGQNQPINANDLGSALGPAVIREIAQRTGMNEQELLQQLSTALPGIVDKLTPNGQMPQNHQVASAFNS
ncbi:MAG: YidB family protein [Alphaproteobacteria bacterium]|nr:YidB family protein [Alphaproteobacteria bacterium]